MFKLPPKSVEADLKDEINLECDVDGNPLEIVWVHAPAAEVSLKQFVTYFQFRFVYFTYYYLVLRILIFFMFIFSYLSFPLS